MRLALSDVKKSISRRGGVARLTPYLLQPGESRSELEALIALYEAHTGQPRAAFPDDRPAELLGDYRLARCLQACVSEDYTWEIPAWPGPASPQEAEALAAHGIASAPQLRLALYDAVNGAGTGYLATENREMALDAFAAALGIARATLDALLALDSETRAVLARVSEAVPTPDELARRYNQRAVEAILASAATVEWTIPPHIGAASGEGLGSVVKRICFLARRMGVSYDVAFDATEDSEAPLARVAESRAIYGSDETPGGLGTAGRAVRVTLYGPQEVMAAPVTYGERLARLCTALLGYRRTVSGRAALSGEGPRGVAQVYLHGRPFQVALDARLLRLLGVAGTNDTGVTTAEYDSSVEARFAAEFAALERSGAHQDWRLEREPEPVLIGGTIVVPDFTLTRGGRRVYLEIAGYWRPGYRERKLRKLAVLKGSVAMVVAAPESARAELGALEASFPVLWYTRDRLSAQALLDLLARVYDDTAVRLAALNVPALVAEVARRGYIPVRESYTLLRVYTRNELEAALHRLAESAGRDAPMWVEGIGLCAPAWLEALAERLTVAVRGAVDGRLALSEAQALLTSEAKLGHAPEAAVEALAGRAGLRMARVSIFEAYVLAPDAGPVSVAPEQPVRPASRAQPRPSARRRVHRPAYETHSFIPGERAGSDDHESSAPDPPTRPRNEDG